METVNVVATDFSKLSKQEKMILEILKEHGGQIEQRTLTRMIAERKGKVEHISRQDALDHARKSVKEAESPELRRLLVSLFIDDINKMPREGRHYVTGSGRASVCRSIRRLEERRLICRDYWNTVYLPERFPGRFRENYKG